MRVIVAALALAVALGFTTAAAAQVETMGMAEDAEVAPGSAPPDPELEAPMPTRAHFVLGAAAGATGLAMHADALFLGGGSFTFGADTRRASFEALVRYEQGQTEYGLTARSFDVAAQFSWVIDRIRLGIAVGPGYFGVDRITSSAAFDFFTIGVEGLIGADLVRTGGFSFGLALRPRLRGAMQFAILEPSDNTAIGGATLGLEVRVRTPRAPKKAATALREPAAE